MQSHSPSYHHTKIETRLPQIEYPTLPRGHTRFKLEDAIITHPLAFGLCPRAAQFLLYCLRKTELDAWVSHDKEPVVSMTQEAIAFDLNKNVRSIYRLETLLVDLGLMTKTTTANGHRGIIAMPDGSLSRYGLSLSPLIERYIAVLNQIEQADQDRRERAVFKKKIQSLRSQITRLFDKAHATHRSSPTYQGFLATYATWPPRLGHIYDLDQLSDLFHNVLTTYNGLVSLLNTKESGKPDIFVRQLLLHTNKGSSVSCNNASLEWPDDKSSENNLVTDTGSNDPVNCSGNEHGRGERGDKPQNDAQSDLLALSDQQIITLASPRLSEYMRVYQGNAGALTKDHFIIATQDIAHDLGISRSALKDAETIMGKTVTAVCLMIIDRNVDHPKTPIKSPGGVLRALTQRFRAGTLNLTASLYGISARTENVN